MKAGGGFARADRPRGGSQGLAHFDALRHAGADSRMGANRRFHPLGWINRDRVP